MESFPATDPSSRHAPWPGNRPFAFTVIDDTDWATVTKLKPVYDLLADLGFRTTKTVWIFRSEDGGNAGETCEDRAYRDWVVSLRESGFEIAFHNAAAGTSPRDRILQALDQFKTLFGSDPSLHCNHTGCFDNLYWGDLRLSGWRQHAYRALTRGRRTDISRGHVAGDPLFWGDLCRERVQYVRNFVFAKLNTLQICPSMPYHDPDKPFVNFWFSAADAGRLATFLRNFTYEKIDDLVRSGGLCVMYTHFAQGFAPNGRLAPEFIKRMQYVADKGGWFVPVSTILDHLRSGAGRAERAISRDELTGLERRWLGNKLKTEAAKAIRRVVRR